MQVLHRTEFTPSYETVQLMSRYSHANESSSVIGCGSHMAVYLSVTVTIVWLRQLNTH